MGKSRPEPSGGPGAEAPSALLLALEVPRAATEFITFLAAAPLLGLAPRGKGHPVLVLPGFMAGDESTFALRAYLESLGYDVYGWQLGRNIGPTRKAMQGMHELLEEVSVIAGEPVSLVGWSLGGIYARELARERAEQVRQVIMLGSPFRLSDGRQSNVFRLYQRYSHLHDEDYPNVPAFHELARPLDVPCTAVYTRTDGVVSWQTCLETQGPQRENIEVVGSHCGLGHNPAALFALADRLAQPAERWRPFRPPRGLASAYPKPACAWEEPAERAQAA